MMTCRPALAWMVAILIVASGVRFAGLDAQSIWFDEGWSAYAAGQPNLLDAARADLTNPPLYYVLLNITTGLFGSSEYALRWPSAALNLLNIALIYALGRRIFDRRAALYAAFLAAVSALLWWASREARMYTLLALLVTIAVYAWHALLRRPTWQNWILLWAAELALLYTHNTGPIAAIWLNAVTILAWLTRRSIRVPDWRVWIAGQAAIGIAWSPWLSLFLDLRTANAALTSAPSLTLQFALNVWQGLLVGVWSIAQSNLFVMSALLILACALVILPWKSPTARWLILHTVLLIGGVIAGLMILGNEYHGRYAVMAAPALLAALGAGLARIRRQIIAVGLATGFCLMSFNVGLLAQQPRYGNDDVRGMVRHYAQTLSAQDTVVAWSYADRYDLRYYWEQMDVQARRVTLPEGASQAAIAPLLPNDGGISLNVWYTQRADYRGMLPCLLGHTSVRVPDQFTTSGMSNLHFLPHAMAMPALVQTSVGFAQGSTPIAHVRQIGTLQETRADQALCVPVILQPQHVVEGSLSAALIVRNALGWEIARADAIVATDDQRTMLLPGENAAAYPLLRLPFGAPSGEYPVYLRLYEPQSMPSGYTPSETTLGTSGRDVLVGVWRVSSSDDWAATGRATQVQSFDARINQLLRLAGLDVAVSSPIRNGDIVRLTLLWEGTGESPALVLRDVNDRWEVDVPALAQQVTGYLLDWRALRIPNNAPSGTASLELTDGTSLGSFVIENTPAQYTAPTFQLPVNAVYPLVGDLVGYTWPETALTLQHPPEVTLVWRAGQSPIPIDYTVFVQLLGEDGTVIAQSDSMPASGMRPTTGWRAGEYVVDRHQLEYNDSAQAGSARLIVGWYDASINMRLRLSTGEDFAVLGTTEIRSN